jgi:hypothetical protein
MTFCCDEMRAQVERTCDLHPDRWDCPDCLVAYSPVRGEFGLMIHDGGTASIQIRFCPWCGTRLSGRDEDKKS